ncbi:hypothetical protein HBI56_119340 [Parastagonospora nodorum]|uniref:Uncharacterized protein n=1 Tax=Phaeosphaeria nodorum (strain SN15 / ATCC MYA-4574 / FGSC 10173) TaxID=321614 RepID=A0A7U2FBS4_PHANO|nr:hypothetical protein HBH56_055430 [Parastagonospora nodorum]QRD02400.1 hypothetical protein JI435_417920 [Parastagonospora nodorum SN15]KAH3935969.1 hypothetical protein HBH54_041240 [Parastagonospora nodorum]KAH3948550.1 hypothetical protein HBH53_098080 [Parastagonospora nodorum]KAH3970120.1 hypothetical protein HBH51_121370 [Parastagonospora nodorum]
MTLRLVLKPRPCPFLMPPPNTKRQKSPTEGSQQSDDFWTVCKRGLPLSKYHNFVTNKGKS